MPSWHRMPTRAPPWPEAETAEPTAAGDAEENATDVEAAAERPLEGGLYGMLPVDHWWTTGRTIDPRRMRGGAAEGVMPELHPSSRARLCSWVHFPFSYSRVLQIS